MTGADVAPECNSFTDDDEAVAYLVWQVDCPCGEVVTYTEDAHPERCESCGTPVREVRG